MRGRSHRTGRALLVVASICLFALPTTLDEVGAAPEPASLDAKERGRRARRLRIRALKYMTARKRFPSRCPLCQGSGKWLTHRGRRRVLVECKQCAGKGAWVSDKHYKVVYYEMRTPAFQKLPGIQEQLEREYRAARAGKPWPRRIARVRIKDVELIDATHAIAWVGIDADKVPTETRWIWVVPKGKKKGEWFAYDARADGVWPAEDGRSQLEPAANAPTWQTLTADEHRAVRDTVAYAGLVFRSIEYRKRGGCLLVRLVPRDAFNGTRALEYVGGDALKLTHAVFDRIPAWQEVETEWLTDFKDAWDRVRTRPAWWASLSRATYAGTSWKGLKPQAQIDTLKWKPYEYEGWAPVPTPGEAPVEPAPTQQEPVEPAPAEPEEPAVPPKTAPPPPTMPQPEIDPDFKIPALPSKAKRAADKALVEMRSLLARAKSVNAEGAVARREGGHALWQEKLAEVRAILGEIEDTWNERVVPEMPGKDDIERDLVANHYFGDIWGDVDQLKAMARKLSSTR